MMHVLEIVLHPELVLDHIVLAHQVSFPFSWLSHVITSVHTIFSVTASEIYRS